MAHKDSSISSDNKFGAVKSGWLERWGILKGPIVKVYHGYGRDGQLQVYGHVFTMAPRERKRYSGNLFRNMWALVRLFIVKPLAGAAVHLEWQGVRVETTTEEDGFFHLQWEPEHPTDAGWHAVHVQYTEGAKVMAEDRGMVYIPHRTQYGFISDIDDTFLISHSSRILKRLYVLFTSNARTRRPFKGVARHYELLSKAWTTPDVPNPFFYVSSSEWNLYNYIREFCRTYKMPDGVYLLSQIKRVSQLLKTGQGKHATKFARIVRVLESYPGRKFVLLGDDTQQDPYIYQSIVKHFPEQIVCVYLRQVLNHPKPEVQTVVDGIQSHGVECCYFPDSEVAIAHSQAMGLLGPEAGA